MKVIIAEKPSVARNIADALNVKSRGDGYIECEGYYITWAIGHLLELYDAKDYDKDMAKWEVHKFPFIPDEFKYKIKENRGKVDTGAKKQLGIIKELIDREEVTAIISATDWDREGQIISDIIIDYIGTKKTVYRLLLNEWTPDQIQSGLKSLKLNSKLKPFSDAGISRQWADWMIGINLTSLATLKYKSHGKGVLNIGRVLMPTLKIVYDRDMEIANFKETEFYRLRGDFETKDKKGYTGEYSYKGKLKFANKESLEKLATKNKETAKVTKREKTRKKRYAPYLFNLTGLQGHITSKYNGWTSEKVLKVAQSLYEKKYITYPRTESMFLEESLKGRVENVLNTLKVGLPYENELKFTDSKRIFDNKKVKSHSAIIPTYLIPKNLTEDESILYEEVKTRFLMQFLPVIEFDETIITTEIDDLPGTFITKGKVIVVEGWQKIEGKEKRADYLPNVKENETVKAKKLKVTTHLTKPPARHTEKTLLSVMETAGRTYNEDKEDESSIMEAVLDGFSIGAASTRGDTISKLKKAKYIKSKGKSLTVTELGKELVESFPVKELFDLDYTGRLEKTLSDIEKEKVEKDEFLSFIESFVVESSEKIKKDGGNKLSEKANEDVEVIGLCPECGERVLENQKAYGCVGWKEGCKFTLWKNDKFLGSMGKKMTKTIAKTLLKEGEVRVNDLTSKKGNKFDAILSYELNKESGYYNWKMEFPNESTTHD